MWRWIESPLTRRFAVPPLPQGEDCDKRVFEVPNTWAEGWGDRAMLVAAQREGWNDLEPEVARACVTNAYVTSGTWLQE